MIRAAAGSFAGMLPHLALAGWWGEALERGGADSEGPGYLR
jgi:hypothetical protein